LPCLQTSFLALAASFSSKSPLDHSRGRNSNSK